MLTVGVETRQLGLIVVIYAPCARHAHAMRMPCALGIIGFTALPVERCPRSPVHHGDPIHKLGEELGSRCGHCDHCQMGPAGAIRRACMAMLVNDLSTDIFNGESDIPARVNSLEAQNRYNEDDR